MFFWTLFMWASTPVHAGDVIERITGPREQSPRLAEELKVWRWLCLGLRFVAWCGQVVILWLEMAAKPDVAWLRYLTGSMVLINVAAMRADLFVLVHVPIH